MNILLTVYSLPECLSTAIASSFDQTYLLLAKTNNVAKTNLFIFYWNPR